MASRNLGRGPESELKLIKTAKGNCQFTLENDYSLGRYFTHKRCKYLLSNVSEKNQRLNIFLALLYFNFVHGHCNAVVSFSHSFIQMFLHMIQRNQI